MRPSTGCYARHRNGERSAAGNEARCNRQRAEVLQGGVAFLNASLAAQAAPTWECAPLRHAHGPSTVNSAGPPAQRPSLSMHCRRRLTGSARVGEQSSRWTISLWSDVRQLRVMAGRNTRLAFHASHPLCKYSSQPMSDIFEKGLRQGARQSGNV